METIVQDKTTPKQERVSLDEQSASKIDLWLEQVVQQVPGIKIGRSEIVRWLVTSHADCLGTEELLQIKERYFDEMEFALWMIRQLKESRARGEKLSLSELLGDVSAPRPTRRAKKRAPLASENSSKEVKVEGN